MPFASLAAVFAIALLSGPTASARAQAAPLEDEPVALDDTRPRDRFGNAADGMGDQLAAFAEAGVFSGRIAGADITLLEGAAGLRLRAAPEVDISVDWGFTWASAHVRGSFAGELGEEMFDQRVERVEGGNPVFTLRLRPHLGASTFFDGGIALAVPVAARAQSPGPRTPLGNVAERAASVAVYDAWNAMHGAWSSWRFAPERLSLVVPLRVGGREGIVGWALHGAAALGVAVLGNGGVMEGALQAALDVSVDVIDELTFGSRLAIVGYGLGGPTPQGQPLLEPWARLELGPAFATLDVTLPIAGARGLGAESAAWAVRIGGGGRLE